MNERERDGGMVGWERKRDGDVGGKDGWVGRKGMVGWEGKGGGG